MDFYGEASFTCTLSDAATSTDTGTVTVTVTWSTTCRRRSNDLRETDEGTALIFAVAELVGNDMDADGDADGDGGPRRGERDGDAGQRPISCSRWPTAL